MRGRSGVGAVTVWVVRAGEELKYLPLFESQDVVGIGWSELPRSPVGMSRQDLAMMLQATYPDASPNTIANNTGQVWNFVNTIALGDGYLHIPEGRRDHTTPAETLRLHGFD